MLDVSFFKTNIFNHANVDAEKVLASLEEDDKESHAVRKRRRLEDFTPQEKMIRRKLKNRVAAQTARDRKKERMIELVKIVARLDVENKELKRSNEGLRNNMDHLVNQNKELHTRLGMDEAPEKVEDHNYSLKCKLDYAFGTEQEESVLSDYKHIMVKKEEEFEFEHAAEITNTSCFVNHDVVIQSQTDQILGLLRQIKPGESVETDASTKTKSQNETQFIENSEIDSSVSTSEFNANLSGMPDEEINELLALCEDIRDLVGEPNHVMSDSVTHELNLITDELLKDIPDEITSLNDMDKSSEYFLNVDNMCSSSDTIKENLAFLYDDKILRDDDTISSSSDEMNLDFYDDFSHSKDGNGWGDVFNELFPSLATI